MLVCSTSLPPIFDNLRPYSCPLPFRFASLALFVFSIVSHLVHNTLLWIIVWSPHSHYNTHTPHGRCPAPQNVSLVALVSPVSKRSVPVPPCAILHTSLRLLLCRYSSSVVVLLCTANVSPPLPLLVRSRSLRRIYYWTHLRAWTGGRVAVWFLDNGVRSVSDIDLGGDIGEVLGYSERRRVVTLLTETRRVVGS